MADITWTRGDTKALIIWIKYVPFGSTTAVYRDLSDCTSITLCVNTEAKPVDATNEVFKIVGDIDVDQTETGNRGKVTFDMDGNEDYLGKYYYDIQAIINTKKDTFAKGDLFVFTQDINKD